MQQTTKRGINESTPRPYVQNTANVTRNRKCQGPLSISQEVCGWEGCVDSTRQTRWQGYRVGIPVAQAKPENEIYRVAYIVSLERVSLEKIM
jgi:hypothetical protein